MLHERSDGNPLFLSRLFDYLMQQELLIDIHNQWHLRDEEAAYDALPYGVRQLLNKQIDQLPGMVQEALKVASVAGMRFTTAMVTAGAESDAGMIDDALSWAASRSYFLQAQAIEVWPDGTISGTYQFGHALYRQILYERLSAERRVKLHRLIGERVERAYIDSLDPVAGLLAYHFTEGREVPQALAYLQRASVRALHRFAANEAITLLNTALGLLPDLPSGYDRPRTEYSLQATLGTAIVLAKGVRMPEASTAYQRAYGLGKAMGDINQFFPTVVGLENMAIGQADYAQSQHMGGQLFNYAQITHDPLHFAHAYCAMSVNRAMQGHYLVAHSYADACARLLLNPGDLRRHPSYTLDPVLMCQRWEVPVLIELGYPDQAIAMSQACMTRARELGDPFSMQQGLVADMILSTYCHPPSVFYESAQTLVSYAVQQGQEFWEAAGTIVLTCAMARLGRATEGLARLETALAVYRTTGYRHCRSLVLNFAIEAYYYAGRIETALALLQEVEVFIDRTGEGIGDSGLYGLRGRLWWCQGQLGEAEACFVRALTLAHQRHAKGAELRAAILLGRLWQEQGEREKARGLLLPIYNGFTEGFDTAELQEAKALLDANTTLQSSSVPRLLH